MSNLDKAKPGISVVIGGQERRIVFDWWALSLIEEEKGPEFLSSLKGQVTLPRLFFLAWAGLVRDNPELDGVTAQKRREGQRLVVDWCSENTDFAKLGEAITQALVNSSPVTTAKGGGAEKNAGKATPIQ